MVILMSVFLLPKRILDSRSKLRRINLHDNFDDLILFKKNVVN